MLLVLFLLSSVYIFSADSSWAIGVSPATIILNNVPNNVRIDRMVTVTRPTSVGVEYFKVSLSGEGARYIELSTTTIMIPNGARSASYNFSIYPQAAPSRTFEAFLQFITYQPSSDSGQFLVRTYEGTTAQILFTITDQQILDYQIANVGGGGNIEVTMPPSLNYTVKNNGNVDAKPDQINLEISSIKDVAQKVTDTILGKILDFTPPLQNKNFSVEFNKTLPLGSYTATATFYRGDKPVTTQGNIKFEVFKEGTLAQKAEFVDFKSSATEVSENTLVKVDGILKNVGSIGVRGTMYVQVYRDGKPLDLIKSDEKFLGIGRSGTFSIEFRPADSGKYSFEGYFSYGVGETERKKVEVNVGNWLSQLSLSSWLSGCSPRWMWLFVIPWLMILIMLVIWWLRHRRCKCPCQCECHGGKERSKQYNDHIHRKDAEKGQEKSFRRHHKKSKNK